MDQFNKQLVYYSFRANKIILNIRKRSLKNFKYFFFSEKLISFCSSMSHDYVTHPFASLQWILNVIQVLSYLFY